LFQLKDTRAAIWSRTYGPQKNAVHLRAFRNTHVKCPTNLRRRAPVTFILYQEIVDLKIKLTKS